ncbi:MAG: hypothetical protein ACRD0D_08815, partial [Acidimicrobiales bacterium]
RWVVFVPAGMVLHDPASLADPVLFRRQAITALGPARAGSSALDLTQSALGLVLELALVDPVPLVLTGPRRSRTGQATSAERLLFTPARPGRVLAEAAARRIAGTVRG